MSKEQTQTAGELAVQENRETVVFSPSDNIRDVVHTISAGMLPDLSGVNPRPVPSSFQYYKTSPEMIGKTITAFIAGVGMYPVPDRLIKGKFNTMECVIFIQRVDEKIVYWWKSASVILVGTIKEGMLSGDITFLKAVDITYIGKKPSKEGNQCDNWVVNVYDNVAVVLQ